MFRMLVSLSVLAMGALAAWAGEPVPAQYGSEGVVGEGFDDLIEGQELREVSVTAIKQGTSLTAEPVAATVVTREEVEDYRVVTMKQVSEMSPNFYIPDYGSRMTSSIYIRGIGARIDESAVGLTVDNVPFLNKDNYDFDLMDIERVEVMRGPQSALYGRNTMGGLISIYTLSPMRFQGTRVLLEGGSGTSFKLGASHYQRLSDPLAMSLSAYFTTTNGFFRNTYNNGRLDKERQGSVRWKTLWQPSDNVDIENTAAVSISRQGGYPYQSVATGQIAYNDTCYYRRDGVTDGLTVNWRLPSGVTLSSISSFQYIHDRMTLDQDFLPLKYFTLSQIRHEWAVTQDFIAKGIAGKYSWMAGAFGFYRRTSMSAPVTFFEDGISGLITGNYNKYNPERPMTWDQDEFLLGSKFHLPAWGVAAYHRSELKLGRWTAAVGLRLDFERSMLDYHSYCDGSYSIHLAANGMLLAQVPVTMDHAGALHRHDLELLPRFSLSYQFGDKASDNIYATVAKGYKSGGYNTQMFSDVLQQQVMATMGFDMGYDIDQIVSYKPEKSWNYEVGAHWTTAEARLELQAAAFFIDCRDQQLTMFPAGTTTGRIMTNAGRTHSYGCELSAAYRPTSRWRVNASYGWTHARFRNFDNGIAQMRGHRVPYAPEHTLFGGVTYRQPLTADFSLDLSVDARGVGPISWDEANTVEQKFYGLLGASVTLNWRDWSLQGWAENLTGTRYATFYFQSMGNSFLQRGLPRRYGATLRLTI